ncbi:hypothetical protein EYR41_007952 [Orbilia oligospora]|uniref:Uncharacterized protein n=1 Tax=Orbilia oligospora TaxID=2813651 RepID=A0A8H2DWQ8_ORBOL|nr:hypothetical protein EYR41_007952 [Orbilia oligospora]
MHSILLAVSLAGLVAVPQVSAHLRIHTITGNVEYGKSRTTSLDFGDYIPFNGRDDVVNLQFDVQTFSNPVIPATQWSPWKDFHRQYMVQGCGATLQRIDWNWGKHPKTYKPFGEHHPNAWKHIFLNFFQKPVLAGDLVPTRSKMLEFANANKIAKVTPGGWVEVSYYQVNADGAGPFRCRFDAHGTGENFGAWLPGIVQPPVTGHNSFNQWGNGKHYLFRVPIPKDVYCGTTYGKYENVCTMRCENYAINGPFGGCFPFQVIFPQKPKPVSTETPSKETKPASTPTPKPKPPSKPIDVKKPEPEPVYGDAGYDVGKGNYDEGGEKYYRRKRDEVSGAKLRRRAAAADLAAAARILANAVPAEER